MSYIIEKINAEALFESIMKSPANLPVTYTFAEKKHIGFSEDFILTSSSVNSDGNKKHGIITGRLNELDVSIKLTLYSDYNGIDWSVKFENNGECISPVLSDLCCADITFSGEHPILDGIYGDGGVDESGAYAPYSFDLSENSSPVHMEPTTGRGTYNYFPYFHLLFGNRGVFLAVGWPIMWKTDVIPQKDGARFVAGQANIATTIEPGETVCSPSITLLFHEGRDTDAAANHWRHWFMDCVERKPGDHDFAPQISGGTSWLYNEMKDATDDNQIDAMKQYIDRKIPISYWWMDAGWYFRTGHEALTTWLHTGTWMVDTNRFPSEFAAISDYGSQHGVKTLLWFEPEMVRLDWKDHDEENGIPYKYMLVDYLCDFGNPEFSDWVFNRFTSILDKGKISLYRQDYGVNPADAFHHTDKPGRVGIRENLYAQGYYAFWDRLIERYPDMMIDSCAAGGGRNDIESMRRAVPLHKTDHDYSNQDDKQSMHQSLFAWLPYFGSCSTGPSDCRRIDEYTMMSNFAPWIALTCNVYSDALDWNCIYRNTMLWQDIKEYFRADYYPLTPWSRGNTSWRGWEFYDPETGSGFFQLFRPENADEFSRSVRLKALEPFSKYELWNRTDNSRLIISGESLLHEGISIIMDKPRSAVLYTFKRL